MRSAAVALPGLICLSAFAAEPALADRFRLALPTPPGHVWTVAAETFAAEFAARTGGEHSVSVFPAGQLGNDAQLLQQLQTGALDMVFMPIAELTNRIPEFGALYAPYLAPDVTAAYALLESDAARELLGQLPARLGVVGIGYSIGGMRQILARGRVDSIDDLKGQKLRITPLDPIRDFYVLLETAPIALPIGAVYDALANGQIDAIDMDLENTWKQKYFDLGETLVLSNHMMFPMVGLVSGARWRTTDPALRATVTELMQARFDAIAATYVDAEAEYLAELKAAGVPVLEAGPEFFGPALAEWEALWSPKAPVLARLKQLAAATPAASP